MIIQFKTMVIFRKCMQWSLIKSTNQMINAYAMGTENSVLIYNTLARTGGFAGCIWKLIISCCPNNSSKHSLKPQTIITTFSTGVTDPSFRVKISERDNDWEVSPCFRKAAPCSSRSLAIFSYNLDLRSQFIFEESKRNPFQVSTTLTDISTQNQIFE